ncbi:MAG: choice-of-anchor Q domain-containing protein [Cyanobacteria bacterium P01_E01_bin.45]
MLLLLHSAYSSLQALTLFRIESESKNVQVIFACSLSAINSTISGNSTDANGGGIFNSRDSDVGIINSTITNNTAPENQGSGIAQRVNDGSERIEVVSSIIAGNTNSDVDVISGDNLSFLRSRGNNLIGTGNAISGFNQPGDITGITDPGLEPLADNGGPTQTHALKANSPAINAGSNPDGLATDQRGDGFSRVVGGGTDIGAFELQDPPISSDSFYFSADVDKTVGSLNVEDEDIIFFDGNDFSIFFDGSNVLPRKAEINAFDIVDDTTILISFSRAINIKGIGRVDDSDVVKFTASSLGKGTTKGRFKLHLDGSDLGLTKKGEDIDALTQMPDGSLLFSTVSEARLSNGRRSKGEDLLRFEPRSLGRRTRGTVSRYVDGSDVNLTRGSENIDAVSMQDDQLILSTRGSFSVPGLSGRNEDAFSFSPTSLGRNTSGTFGDELLFDGSQAGFTGNLSGFDIGIG